MRQAAPLCLIGAARRSSNVHMCPMASPGNQDRKRTAEPSKTAQESQNDPHSPIGSLSEHRREHAGKPAKTMGLAVGCSRLFPAVPGTRDRKRTAGTALRSFLHPIRTFDVGPRARHIFAFSQSAATVVSRAAAILASVATETLNSPRSIAPK